MKPSNTPFWAFYVFALVVAAVPAAERPCARRRTFRPAAVYLLAWGCVDGGVCEGGPDGGVQHFAGLVF